jgi:hypothetical protein
MPHHCWHLDTHKVHLIISGIYFIPGILGIILRAFLDDAARACCETYGMRMVQCYSFQSFASQPSASAFLTKEKTHFIC